ncbi:MAG: hypothetical protein JXR60_01325 [Bacteroidales bacterium]|nr:hypothetical protein [Bacteroidales bacterium]
MSNLIIILIIVAALASVILVLSYIKTKRLVFLLNLGLVFVAELLAYFLIWGIQEPIDFAKERDHRYEFVIKNLIDIRKAQEAYKDEKGVFANNFDDLINFVKYDSMTVVRKLGSLPDSLGEAGAMERGMTIAKLPETITKDRALKAVNKIIKEDLLVNDDISVKKALNLGFLVRDTIKISVQDTIFGKTYPIDSLRYVPFSSKHAQFKLAAGEIETASKIKVQVFEAIDTDPFDPNKILKVGSLTEATNNAGNWE